MNALAPISSERSPFDPAALAARREAQLAHLADNLRALAAQCLIAAEAAQRDRYWDRHIERQTLTAAYRVFEVDALFDHLPGGIDINLVRAS